MLEIRLAAFRASLAMFRAQKRAVVVTVAYL